MNNTNGELDKVFEVLAWSDELKGEYRFNGFQTEKIDIYQVYLPENGETSR